MDYPYTDDKRQYRSALFCIDDDQISRARKVVRSIESKAGGRRVYIDVEKVTKFYLAEDYHQDFLAKRRDGFGD
jgi:peptide methionine sulfoxide reductase MsrA